MRKTKCLCKTIPRGVCDKTQKSHYLRHVENSHFENDFFWSCKNDSEREYRFCNRDVPYEDSREGDGINHECQLIEDSPTEEANT